MTLRQHTFAATLCGCAFAGVVIAGGAYGAIHMTEIGQRGKVFSLEEVSLPVGGTIRVINDDNILHSLLLTTPDGTRTNLGTEKPGEHMDFTMETLGDYIARCGIHPAMKLVIHAR